MFTLPLILSFLCGFIMAAFVFYAMRVTFTVKYQEYWYLAHDHDAMGAAFMPWTYAHLVEMVNTLMYIREQMKAPGFSRFRKYPYSRGRKLIHDDIIKRSLERIELLENAARVPVDQIRGVPQNGEK